MNIKNYTSTVTAESSMANIEKWLVEIGAHNINKSYKDKMCTGISFLHFDAKVNETIAYRIKAQPDEAFNIFWKEVKRPQADTKEKIRQQALRTAWKIMSDWTEIQCTMILLGQATPLQMFLPLVYDPATDETLYDRVVTGKTKILN